jgi:hypothetical protein
MAHRHARHSDRSDQPLVADPLYGDRELLRHYRDATRDEHRRFVTEYEQAHGNAGRADELSEYDRIDLDRVLNADYHRHLNSEGIYEYSGDAALLAPPNRDPRPKPQREHAQHRGKGPRDYQRADQRIYEDVCERLADDDHVDATDIEVSVNGGEVTLTGKVRSRTSKRRATQVAESVSGVKDVFNSIRILDEQGR